MNRSSILLVAILCVALSSRAWADHKDETAAAEDGFVRLEVGRWVVPYSGEVDLSWMGQYPFATEGKNELGIALRLVNDRSSSVWVWGRSLQTVLIDVETKRGARWESAHFAICGHGIQDLELRPHESFELQVPFPRDAHVIRIVTQYRAAPGRQPPQTIYSAPIVRRAPPHG